MKCSITFCPLAKKYELTLKTPLLSEPVVYFFESVVDAYEFLANCCYILADFHREFSERSTHYGKHNP